LRELKLIASAAYLHHPRRLIFHGIQKQKENISLPRRPPAQSSSSSLSSEKVKRGEEEKEH